MTSPGSIVAVRMAAAVLGLLLASWAGAAERILDYASDIVVHADASVTVTETIAVQAEGTLIRRGIYRDFPTTYRDRLGNRYRVGFEVLSVRRDGEPEAYHIEKKSNGVRVYMGRRDRTVEPGRHVYEITYRTDRQLGYFDSRDELYWNVTGTGWAFPIDQASASVTLPETVPMGQVSIEGYTGPQGSTGRSYAAQVDSGQAHIATTRPLGPGEGLTLVVSWPKGHVYEPTAGDRLRQTLYDNRGLAVAILGLAAVLAYLLFAWHRYGRDPEPGVIFPHYEPPAGYSPASARFIREMGYDDRAFAAAVINLAVKGWIEIREDDEEYVLTRTGPGEDRAPGERELMDALFADGDVVDVKQDNHKLLGAAKSAHKKALERDYEKVYFFTNSLLLLPSLAGAVLMFLAIAATGSFRPLVLVPLALIVVAHVVFYFLLKAPTRRGRVFMDKIEGFRSYLEVAEKQDLNLRNPPEKTPELFERYLPFALALGVEQEWAEQFADVFARLDADRGTAWRPGWYHGTSFGSGRMAQVAAGVGAGLTTAIASASTPPGSSSGSGGFSGGGGGGGGGGGW
ncbi:MAG: DUF2207 domain-containing protein [Gammaproteobacteria bacterium]